MKKKSKKDILSDKFLGNLNGENMVAALILVDAENRKRVLKVFEDVKNTNTFDFNKLCFEDQNAILEFVKKLYKTT